MEIDGGKLLFPFERADEFVAPLRRFLDEHSPSARVQVAHDSAAETTAAGSAPLDPDTS